MKFIVNLVMSEENMPEDVPFSSKVPLEFCLPGDTEEEVLKKTQDRPSPRILSSHAHLRFIEKQVIKDKVKVIVVMRNPKDTLVVTLPLLSNGPSAGILHGHLGRVLSAFQGEAFVGR